MSNLPQPINFSELDQTNSYQIKLTCHNCKEENVFGNTKMPFGVPVLRFTPPVRFNLEMNRPIGGNYSGYFLASKDPSADHTFFHLDCEFCQCPHLQ